MVKSLHFVSRWVSVKSQTFLNLKQVLNFNGNRCGMKLCLEWHNLSAVRYSLSDGFGFLHLYLE